MVNKLCLTLLLLCTYSYVSSQSTGIENKMGAFQSNLDLRSNVQKKLLLDKKFTIGTEVLVFPNNQIIFQIDDVSKYESWLRPVTIGIANFTFEPRFNLKEFDSRRSLFIRVPIGLSFSVTTSGFYSRSKGFFHASGAVLFGLGQKLGSTLRNVENTGSAVSLGLQYLRAPLLGHNLVQTVDFIYDTEISTKKNWLLPVFQLDLYKINKKDKLRGSYFMVGLYNAFYFKFGFTIP